MESFTIKKNGRVIIKEMLDEYKRFGLTEAKVAALFGIHGSYLSYIRKKMGWKLVYRSDGGMVHYPTREDAKRVILENNRRNQNKYNAQRRAKGIPMYVQAYVDGKSLPMHRAVMEKMIGRKLRACEVVHHIDGNRANNKPSNLLLFKSPAEHHKHHVMLRHSNV